MQGEKVGDGDIYMEKCRYKGKLGYLSLFFLISGLGYCKQWYEWQHTLQRTLAVHCWG